MLRARLWRHVAFIVCFSCSLSAQNKSVSSGTPLTRSSKKPPLKQAPGPKLTPEQKRGLRLLKDAQAQAAGLEPAMQTFILLQVSHGFRKVAPKKADAVLRRAFTASRSIQDQDLSKDCPLDQASHIQRWLQREILLEILQSNDAKDMAKVEKLLPQAAPEVKDQIVERLVHGYLSSKNLEHARQLMDGMDPNMYWFELAGEMMEAIPASRANEKMVLFEQALRNYENQDLEAQEPNEEDFGVFLSRFWRELPSGSVLDAVDTILERSKERDETKKVNSVAMTLWSGGSLNFGSEYEYRLFQLLPILRELDDSKAEQLLKEHNDTRTALDRYPKGMQSIDPNFFGSNQPDTSEMPVVAGILPAMSDDPTENRQFQSEFEAEGQLQAQVMNVQEESRKDPEKAYQDALNLPLRHPIGNHGCPRASGLRYAAFGLATENPSLAKSAMNEVRRLAEDIDPYWQQIILANVPEFYIKLGDEDGARSAIKDQVKMAEKLYAADVDSSDPNLAFKGAWPSANTWRNCIQQATKLSPSFAEELLQEIPDPEISGFERVIYANSLLGAGKSNIAVIECHKNRKVRGTYMTQ